MSPNYRRGDFGAFVGAAISRPVVSPAGKQRRRNAPTMVISNILQYNLVVSDRNVVHWQHWGIGGCVTVLPRDLQRWRADDIRPYELKDFERSAKYAPGAMRYVCVGAAISRPVVAPEGKQRRRSAPTMQYRTFYNIIWWYQVETWYIDNMIPHQTELGRWGGWYNVVRSCHRIMFLVIDGSIVGALRRRCFSHGKTTGRMISAPTQTYRIAHGA